MNFGTVNLFVLNIITTCQGYIHLASMKVYQHDTNKTDSLFGYSIAYQAGIQRLIISSPLENENGQMFTLSLNSSNIEKVTLDTKLIPRKSNVTSEQQVKHNFWLGATVKANSNFFVTCAPRYAEMKSVPKPVNRKFLATLGLCFLFEYTNLGTYVPRRLTHMANKDRNRKGFTFGDNLDSIGWSMDITKSGEILIGSPAMMTGRVVLYENPYSRDFPKLINNMNQENLAYYNYGYTVTTGEFFGERVYAISSTFGFGKVYFFDSKLQNIEIIKDKEIGSMFGAALCPARLGTQALLVGAPAYFDKTFNYDVGSVYVYLDQTEEGSKKMLLRRKIKGMSSGSYFGHAIASLGDIDGDNKDEIVVAAPFEDGMGAVYYFSGASIFDGLAQPRKIQPEGFQSFGFSLTILEDLDGNGCNDLAVGSPKDNKVVIFKSMAFIKVILKAVLNQRSDEEFLLTICIDGVYPLKPENITADMIIDVKLKFAMFKNVTSKNGVYGYEVSMGEKKKHCEYFTLQVQHDAEREGSDYEMMSYEVTASLKEDPEKMKEFDPSRVLLSDESILKQQGVKWKEDTTIQEPLLLVNISSSIEQPYMIGSSSQETFILSVLNEGGAAKAACLHLAVEGARVIAHPSFCKRELDDLLCRHNHIISSDDVWINEIQIETDYLTSIHDNLTVRCNVYPQCDGKNVSSYEEIIELRPYNNMVVIKGQSNPDEKLPVTTDDLHMGKSFDHVYTIYNYGLTNWVGLEGEIMLQNSPFIDYSDAPIKVYAYTSVIECEIGNKNISEENIRVLCKIGDLGRQEKVIVVVAMKIGKDALKFDDEDQNVTVTTSMELLLRDGHKYLNLNTTLTFEPATVPLWVTLASSFLGVFLLIIIAYILYEYGFLQRKTKEKLNETKKEVYRQSVRRSMMRESVRAAINRRSTEENDILMEEIVQESDL